MKNEVFRLDYPEPNPILSKDSESRVERQMKNEVFRYNKAGIKKDRTKERIPLSCHINKMKKRLFINLFEFLYQLLCTQV